MTDSSPGADLQAELEQGLLGGRRRYTREEVAELSGVSLDRAQRLWTAMGFAENADVDAVMFTRGDVQALRTLDGLVRDGVVAPELEVAVTRALGQSLARLAEWQVDLVNSWVVDRLADAAGGGTVDEADEADADEADADEADVDPDVLRAAVSASAQQLLPTMEALQSYVWRRHLAASAGRALVQPGDELARRTLTVGFADMVGYTSLTRRLDVTELTALLERFESTATAVVAAGHGWVVKNVGDEVMFACDSAVDAAQVALALQEAVAAEDDLPGIRVGMATGTVLVRFGDLFGSVVNLAARLTSAAKPGSTLVDRETAAALAEDPGLHLKQLRAVRARGFSRQSPLSLRRARV